MPRPVKTTKLAKLPRIAARIARRSVKSLKSQTARNRAIERFAHLIIQVVHEYFPKQAFSRDDILVTVSQLRVDSDVVWADESLGINDTATGTRYRKVCDAIMFLVDRRQLVALDWVTLCLPEVASELRTQEPRHEAYLPTVRRLIEQFAYGSLLDSMRVVGVWTSDQHIPENIKKMTVRSILPVLVREGVIRRGEFTHQFIVGAERSSRRPVAARSKKGT